MSYAKKDLTISREWMSWADTQMLSSSSINNQGSTNSTLVADLSMLTTNSSWLSNRWRPCKWCSNSNSSRWTLTLLTCTKGFSLTTPQQELLQCLIQRPPKWITFKWDTSMAVLINRCHKWTTPWCSSSLDSLSSSLLFLWSLLPGLKLLT